MDLKKFKAGDYVKLDDMLSEQFPGMTTGRIVKFDEAAGNLCPFIAWNDPKAPTGETDPIPFIPATGLVKTRKPKGV